VFAARNLKNCLPSLPPDAAVRFGACGLASTNVLVHFFEPRGGRIFELRVRQWSQQARKLEKTLTAEPTVPSRGLRPLSRLGCQWDYHHVWVVHSPIEFVDFTLVDLILTSKYF
jgi:hypothetical protein